MDKEDKNKMISFEVELDEIKRKYDEIKRTLIDLQRKGDGEIQDRILNFFADQRLGLKLRDFSLFSQGWARMGNIEVNNEANVSIEGLFIDVDEVLIVLNHFRPVNSAVNLALQFKIGGNWITSGYQWGGIKMYGGGSGSEGSTSASGIVIATNVGNASSHFLFAESRIFLPTTDNVLKIVRNSAFYISSEGVATATENVGFLSGNTGIIEGIRIYFSSGNIAQGRLLVFGRQRR